MIINLNNSYRSFDIIQTKNKVLIIILLFFTFLLGLVLPSVISRNSSTTPVLISPTPQPSSANVEFITEKKSVNVGESFIVQINLSSPDQGVEAADFVVSFNPQSLKPVSIIDGNYFPNYPVKKISQNSIKISATATLINNKIIIPKGDGVVAKIEFAAIKPIRNTKITFDSLKTIIASGGENITGKLSGLSISIK